MDEFGLDRPELTGSLISMEFRPGGRIQQLWAADPNLPDQNEEFQFVIAPLGLGEEFAEDYFPGTILLGARLNPDDPWMVSRNSEARQIDEDLDPSRVTFEYEFSLLPEIGAVGKYYEVPGPIPQIVWELEITNNGRRSLEIGELAFPFALNNIYEGFPRSQDGVADLLKDRVYVHPFIGGSASYLFAQRMNSESPGLLIYPGADTRWEFTNHVRASLNTPYRWEGIPVVYIHSRAAIEREGWGEWFNEHSSIILEAGDVRRYETRFAPADRNRFDSVHPTLAACGRPAIRLLPAAVVPAEVGIAVEVGGVTPTQFYTNVEAELETDSDEEGGFCFIKPSAPGVARLTFEDTGDRVSNVHLLFTEPLEKLIQARAQWIVEKQVVRDPAHQLNGAIVPYDLSTDTPMLDPDDFSTPFGIESSLSDALFLAEKNTIYPDREQISILETYCADFLLDDVQNPGDGSVGVLLSDPYSISSNTGHAPAYPLVFSLYHALYRIGKVTDETSKPALDYLRQAARTALALFRHVPTSGYRGTGVALMPNLQSIIDDLETEGEAALAERIREQLGPAPSWGRASSSAFGQRFWSLKGFEQAFFGPWIGMPRADREELISLAYAARSLSPSWWWYGSDKRFLEELDAPHPAMADKGELCLGPTSVANSLMLFETLDKDQPFLPESWMRMAFGGMLGVWALVRADGAASMGFCPDASSRQYGISALSGDVGISLYRYLRNVTSYVLPSGVSGTVTFGCHFASETQGNTEEFVVRPWDGVNRRIVVRQLGIEASSTFGRILELRFDARKRRASVLMQNPAEKDLQAILTVRGLWGTKADVSGTAVQADPGDEGALRIPVSLQAGRETKIEIRITG